MSRAAERRDHMEPTKEGVVIMKENDVREGPSEVCEAPTAVCEGKSEGSSQAGATRRRVAGEAGFDVACLRRRSERRAVRPILPLTLSLNLR